MFVLSLHKPVDVPATFEVLVAADHDDVRAARTLSMFRSKEVSNLRPLASVASCRGMKSDFIT